MFLNPPRWTVVFVDENFIVINDLKMITDLTITNGIEQVTQQINAEYDLTKRHLIYGDSMGLYDAIDVNDEGNFYNFLYLGVGSHLEAIEAFKEKYQHLLKGK
ncbi:hypothetical protein ACRJAL_003758 [Acinetobacter baumannii]|uniref:hypothetical protein n=1 Tax=Acinetobacter variabilis TaxID=70346 RepID=UPI00259D5FA5|nr:hypothetical protein [Acinetobacter variabilis]EKV2617680.1 hypothetical protein [Acinetobacter baumannii]